MIDGMMRRLPTLPGLKFQHAPSDGQVPVGRNDIDMVRLYPQVMGDIGNRHRRNSRENLGQRTLMIRIQMLHQDKTHAGIRRQMFEQLR